MAEPYPIPRHPAFIDITGKLLPSGIRVLFFLGKKQWLCVCPCGCEFQAGGAGLLKGYILRCRECRWPSVKPERKACLSCEQELPFTSEFFAASCQHPFGLRARCRFCTNATSRKDAREDNAKLRLEVLYGYCGPNPSCLCCGETILEFLSIDHIDGGGAEHRRQCRNQATLYRELIREGFPPTCRILCHNCNQCCRSYGFCVHNPERIRGPGLNRAEKVLVVPDAFDGTWQACIKCGTSFPATADFFSKHRYMANGFLHMCKRCQWQYQEGQRHKLRDKHKRLVCSHYSGGEPRCACCSESHLELLSIDHINGGGGRERREKKISNMYRWIIKSVFPEYLQVLCFNCNLAKGFCGECPHIKIKVV